jgi:nitric oxide reductase large subunit
MTGGREIAGLIGTFNAKRHLGFYVGKAFISVAIIVFMSWVVFWIAPEHVGPRLSVAVTSMLTLVAYRFLLGQGLPPVSYLTRLDFFLLGSTILVFIALIQVALTSAMNDESAKSRRVAINRISRWAFPVVFLALFAAMFWA